MQTIGVNIVPGNFPQFVRYSQNDIGREFKINVVDFEIPSGATVECVATKPSGLGFTVSGTVTGNTVSFVTTAIMTDEWGKFPAELRITSGGVLLGTANFMFIGERNPHPEGTTDGQQETLIPELTLLVNEIRESNARVAEMTASAHASNEPTAEYDADTNNLEFGIPSISEEDYLKLFVTDSASGSIASITDGGDDLPMKSLKVSIVPKQSGSGDPSPDNVRPISGWSGVNVTRAGKNIVNLVYGNKVPSVSTGEMVSSSGWSTDFTKVDNTKDYTVSITDGISRYIFFYDKDFNFLSAFTQFTTGYRLSTNPSWANTAYIKARTDESQSSSFQFQIEKGSTATAYEPYQGESYPISLPSTVYGGTLDVTSGVLKSYPYYSSYNGETLSGEWICDRAVYSQGTTPPIGSQVVDMSGTGTEYQLTPTEVNTLLGNNNIYSDAGSVEVEYRADTKLYIDKLLGNTRTLSMAMAPTPETTEETEDDQR